jgi:RNA polymerase sigma-70 factor (ECF subfamily)
MTKMDSSPKISREFVSFVKEYSRIINKVCWAYATPKVPYEDLRQ